MHRLIQLSLAAALSALVNTASAAATDISGMSVGLQLSDARSLLAKINPAYKTEEIRFSDGKTNGLKAVAAQNGQPVDQMVIMANEANIVWFIGRQQNYVQGQRIPLAELEKALIQKYGEPSQSMSGQFSWQRYRDGRMHPRNKMNGPCPPTPDMNRFPGTSIPAPQSFAAECGMRIAASAQFSHSDQMVTQLVTTVIDVKRIFDELKAKEQATQREQQQIRQQEQSNKPKL